MIDRRSPRLLPRILWIDLGDLAERIKTAYIRAKNKWWRWF